jgi:hypothetical protein
MAVDNKVAVASTVSADKYNWIDVAASRIVGRKAAGDVCAMTVAEVLALLDVYTQDQVDALIQGVDWQESVKDRYDPTPGLPGGPSTGDRYIATATANGWTIHYIYQYNGASWTEIIPDEGSAAWVEDENIQYVFNGASWVKMAGVVEHNALSTIQGGQADQYYHLKTAQHTQLVLVGDLTAAANSLAIYTGAGSAAMTAVAEDQIVGRKTGGTLGALTAAEVRTLLGLDGIYAKLVGAVDIEITDATKGLILRDTQGTPHKWRVTVDNSGNLVTTDLGVA